MMNDIDREYSDEFDKMRKARVYVSYHKYGPARKKISDLETINKDLTE